MREILQHHKKFSEEIKKALKSFEKNDRFYELCYCTLTPQSNAKKCWAAVEELQLKNFRKKTLKPEEIEKILKTKTRFYRNKTKYLLHNKKAFPEIAKTLPKNGFENTEENKISREEIVKLAKGISYKEATHFLRNTGHKNLAILDRHILRNLVKYGVIEKIPEPLKKQDYFEIEKKFQQFAKRLKIPIDEIDQLFWSMQTGEVFK